MRYFLLVLPVLVLAGCFGERAPLPVLQAPNREAVVDVPPDGVIETRPGDTIYTVANRYRVTPRRVILANELPPPYDLSGRRTIRIPKPRTHTVRRGDTLDTISGRYRVRKSEIIRLNAMRKPYGLRPGMKVAIPRKLDYSLLDLPATSRPSTSATANIKKRAVKPKTPIRDVRFSDRGKDFAWPLDGTIVDRFGTAARGVHNDGVNIAADLGTPVRASLGGEVAFVGTGLKSFGNLVLIKHSDGWITAYAHLGEISVAEGDLVRRGALVGTVGQSGKVASPQLHFELRKSRTPVNPEEYLS